MVKEQFDERSGDLSIKNPQYAFLETDYRNPNLTQTKPEKNQVKSSSLINKPKTNVLYNINWILLCLSSIPADLYCITIFVLSNYL